MTQYVTESSSPVLPPDTLRALTLQVLALSSVDTVEVQLDHLATGVTRISRGRVWLNNSGDTLQLGIYMQSGQRRGITLSINQIDTASLRQAVQYLERAAREQPGDPTDVSIQIPPRTYLPNTTWHDATVTAFTVDRHDMIETVTAPVIAAGLSVSAFVGVALHSRCYADKQGLIAAAQETDSEIVVTGRTISGKGSGWAGQAARDWTTLRPGVVADEAIRLTRLAANPVLFEPGRHVTILDRPAVAQIVARMGGPFNAESTINGVGPLYDGKAGRVRLDQRVLDSRLTLSSDPNDAEGGYIPFNLQAYPLVPMVWIEGGILKHLAYQARYAAKRGVAPSNDPPDSLRLACGASDTPLTVEEMIANCEQGIYVNRFSQIEGPDPVLGVVTGVTNGACLLVRHGKIEKAIRDLRFVESPWYFLNRVVAIGTSQRSAFGYAPWQGDWPIAPTIVPPLMINDFNFVALADAV